MKKIILAFEGIHFSEGAFEFALRLNEIQPVLLTGVFLPQTELANYWSYAATSGSAFIPTIEGGTSEVVQENIARFERLCRVNGIDYHVHKDFYDLALPELKRESRFADLLILGSEIFYNNIGIDPSYDYVKDVLQDIACPVLLVPEKFDFPESIVLAYDGSEAAVFAIKQFAYLFPELGNIQTLLVYVNQDLSKDFPDKIQIEELATRHYSNLTFSKLDINPGRYFETWITNNKYPLLVSGSYGRSGISLLFKKSFVQDIIADHSIPVFIAHR